MFKTKVFTAKTPEELEKNMNAFLDELTNATILQLAYQHYHDEGSVYFTSLIVYQINHGTTQFGSA